LNNQQNARTTLDNCVLDKKLNNNLGQSKEKCGGVTTFVLPIGEQLLLSNVFSKKFRDCDWW